jgi:hypothetical protein
MASMTFVTSPLRSFRPLPTNREMNPKKLCYASRMKMSRDRIAPAIILPRGLSSCHLKILPKVDRERGS